VTLMGNDRPPYLPSHRTMHLMAKAAVAVYEAGATDKKPLPGDHDEQAPGP
jgi:hypothetical protein